MIRRIERIDDARAIVRDAGLSGSWYPVGTDSGFADWLYLNRMGADPLLLTREKEEYLTQWLQFHNEGWSLDEASRKDVEKDISNLAILTTASHEMAAEVAEARTSATGRRALHALSWLATSAGANFGPRSPCLQTLDALAHLLNCIAHICRVVPPGWMETYRDAYLAPRARWRTHFSKLEMHMRERPMHNMKNPHIAVALTVALVRDKKVHREVTARRTAGRMLETIVTTARPPMRSARRRKRVV